MTVSEVIESVQYMVDENGKRTAAVIQMGVWQNLLELLHTSDLAAEAGINFEKTPEQVIANVKARPIHPETIIPPKGSLLVALKTPTYDDEDFNLEEWTKQWQAVEHEMKTLTRQNDLAEGRI